MPLILPYDLPNPVVVMAGGSDVAIDGAVRPQIRLAINCGSTVSIAPFGSVVGTLEIEGGSDVDIFGRLNDEPNELGAIDIECGSDVAFSGRLNIKGKLIIEDAGSTVEFGGRIATADTSAVSIVLNVTPANNAVYGDTISARISADGVNYPIRSANYNEDKQTAGVSLQCVLQKPADRAAILAATSFKFEIYANGGWSTMFESGIRTGAGFSFAFAEARPNDSLSISTAGPAADRLNRSPVENLTVYDPLRETLNVDMFPAIKDTDGVSHFHELHAIGDMTLHDLFQYIFVTRCGFASFKTDISDDPIRRADFDVTSTFLAGLAPHIGAYSPLIYVVGDVVWIRDMTQKRVAGFATPYPLTAGEYKEATFTVTDLNADGYILTFAEIETEFDYTTDREIIDTPDELGSFGDVNYQEIQRRRIFRDYFKSSAPLVPVRTDKIREFEVTRAIVGGTLFTIESTVENRNYDGFGKLQTIRKETTALIPQLHTPGFPYAEQTTRIEATNILYQPDLHNFRRQVASNVTKTITGLVVTDSENQHLDKPFKQEFNEGNRAGNLSATQAIAFRPIETTTQTFTQNPKGETEIRSKTVNFLTTPPTTINPSTDNQAGDGSINGQSATPHQVEVFRTGAIRTSARMLSISVGEMPYKKAVALVRRRLESRQAVSGQLPLRGIRPEFARGFEFEAFDRDGGSVGVFIVEGRSISLSNLGLANQTTRQTVEVSLIGDAPAGTTIDTAGPLTLTATAGDDKAFQLDIECKAGYLLSAISPDAGVEIWGKAETGDLFQNLATDPIDLTPYANTVKTFYFEARIDAGEPAETLIFQLIVSL